MNVKKEQYRQVFIVDQLSYWNAFEENYDYLTDLVLTYDFGLFKHIEKKGGDVNFIDSLVNPDEMHSNNHLLYKFIRGWYLNSDGKDIFEYKGIPFGFSFKLEIWNDLVYYTRLCLCLRKLKGVKFENINICSEDKTLYSVLDKLNLRYTVSYSNGLKKEAYFFQIFKYIDEKIRAKGLRGLLYKAREIVSSWYGRITILSDKFTIRGMNKAVFIQEYHPTKAILEHLRNAPRVNVLLANFSRGSKFRHKLSERIVPIYGDPSKFESISDELMTTFTLKKQAKLVFDDGFDITNELFEIIEFRIRSAINEKLRVLSCSVDYIDNNDIALEILIANIGQVATVFDCVCKTRGIPSYLIINGLLGPEYDDEAKHAKYINSYSENIRDTYFSGMDNIVTLGDPRMDMYPPQIRKKKINRIEPVVVIGTSGFNSVDLNSYVSVEFDFMYDVLTALQKVIKQGVNLSIIVKVRPNGYIEQYQAFINEYFKSLKVKLIADKPMVDVLNKADYYISIYSQTLFEASCLGIPVLYYRKDSEVMFAPFDNNSELVTATSVDELIQAFNDYQNNHNRYDKFLDRRVMEKYIGPLDGNNLERNLDYIHTLLGSDDVNLGKR